MPSANCFASPARERQPRLTQVVRIRPRLRDRPTGRAAPAEIVDIASSHRQSGLLLPPGGISSRMSSLLLLATRASPWRRPRTPVGNRCTVTAPWRRVQPFVAALPDGAVPPWPPRSWMPSPGRPGSQHRADGLSGIAHQATGTGACGHHRPNTFPKSFCMIRISRRVPDHCPVTTQIHTLSADRYPPLVGFT